MITIYRTEDGVEGREDISEHALGVAIADKVAEYRRHGISDDAIEGLLMSDLEPTAQPVDDVCVHGDFVELSMFDPLVDEIWLGTGTLH